MEKLPVYVLIFRTRRKGDETEDLSTPVPFDGSAGEAIRAYQEAKAENLAHRAVELGKLESTLDIFCIHNVPVAGKKVLQACGINQSNPEHLTAAVQALRAEVDRLRVS